MRKIICPECRTEMELYGIFDSGELKFYCPNCYRMLDKEESRQLDVKK